MISLEYIGSIVNPRGAMAEKNTESTAVNQLIELVATQKPLAPDPSEDLMFSEKPAAARTRTKQMSPARMTATVPPIRGAGEVQPLPRTRAPVGTQQGIQAIKAVPPAVPKVRISTAPPSRTVTIPPVATPRMPLDYDDNDNEVTNPERDVMSRVTKPTLPPPLPAMRGISPSRPSIPTSSFDYPVVKHQAQELPVVAPPISAPLLLEEELVTSAAVTNPALSFEVQISTHQVPKTGDWKAIASKLIAPMVVLVIIGIFVGGYFAFDGDGGKKRTAKPEAPTKITMPVTQAAAAGDVAKVDEPKSEPVVAPAKVDEPKSEPPAKVDEPKPEPAPAIATTEPAATTPALVDIRVDSSPSGATVNLIDRGKSMYLGTTPLSAAVDASRKYELVFSYENRTTLVEALDPTTQKRVSVKLSRVKHSSSSSAPVETPKAEAKLEEPKTETKRERKHRSKSEPKSGIDAALAGAIETGAIDAPKLEEPKFDDQPPARGETKREPAAKADVGGEGTLMISSKPPCEIVIDGKSTGLTTPQRSIALPAGAHKITLVNTAEGIRKTVSVRITADKPTKVIQDFMK